MPSRLTTNMITRRSWLRSTTAIALAATAAAPSLRCAWGQGPQTPSDAIRGKIVLPRTGHAWMSQQVEEPCILVNPKDPTRLIMFYSAVSQSNRAVAAIGKAWADVHDPVTWHQDDANPIFQPSGHGWDAASIRLDCVLHIPEEDAYYIYYSALRARSRIKSGWLSARWGATVTRTSPPMPSLATARIPCWRQTTPLRTMRT